MINKNEGEKCKGNVKGEKGMIVSYMDDMGNDVILIDFEDILIRNGYFVMLVFFWYFLKKNNDNKVVYEK